MGGMDRWDRCCVISVRGASCDVGDKTGGRMII